MIPETKLNAVKNAIQETFGVCKLEDIREITAGLTFKEEIAKVGNV